MARVESIVDQPWVGLGLLVAAALALWNLRRRRPPLVLAVAAGTAGVYGALLGSRLLAVLAYNPYLLVSDPLLAMSFWLGGQSWLGAVLGGLAVFGGVLALRHERGWLVANGLVPGLALLHAVLGIEGLLGGSGAGAPHSTRLSLVAFELLVAVLLQALWSRGALRSRMVPLYVLSQCAVALLLEELAHGPAGPPLAPGFTTSGVVHASAAAASLVVLLPLRGRRALAAVAAAGVGLLLLSTGWWTPPPPALTSDPEEGVYLVLTRDRFASALSAFARYRERQGHRVRIESWGRAPEPRELVARIRERRGSPLRAILLVGDAAAAGEEEARWHLPSLRTPEGRLSDTSFGELDGDGVPDVPVGRLPVRTRRELRSLVNKIVVYEGQRRRGGDFRLLMWTGAPGYESAISTLVSRVHRAKPQWLDFYGLCGSPSSAFSGHVPDQPHVFLRELARPSLLSFAVVHGSEKHMNAANHEGRPIHVGLSHVASLASIRPGEPLLVLACKSGRFDLPTAEGSSLSEAFLLHPGGPVAVVAASGNDGPLTNYLALLAVSDALRERSVATIGDLLLHYQRELHAVDERGIRARDAGMGGVESILRSVGPRRATEFASAEYIREGALRYNLLGDPLIRLELPEPVPVDVRPAPGGWIASGPAPEGTTSLRVDFVDRASELAPIPPSLGEAERRRRFASVNREPTVVARAELDADTWELELGELPACDSGECYLRFRLLGARPPRYAVHRLEGRAGSRGKPSSRGGASRGEGASR